MTKHLQVRDERARRLSKSDKVLCFFEMIKAPSPKVWIDSMLFQWLPLWRQRQNQSGEYKSALLDDFEHRSSWRAQVSSSDKSQKKNFDGHTRGEEKEKQLI